MPIPSRCCSAPPDSTAPPNLPTFLSLEHRDRIERRGVLEALERRVEQPLKLFGGMQRKGRAAIAFAEIFGYISYTLGAREGIAIAAVLSTLFAPLFIARSNVS